MTTEAGTGTASSRREKEDTRYSVAEYYDMIEKEYASAGHIIFFRRLVPRRQQLANESPAKIKRAFVSHGTSCPASLMLL